MIWLVLDLVAPRDPVAARRIILISAGLWFVTDCAGSFAAAAPMNALFNLGFLLIFVLPLLRTGARAPA